MYYCLGLLSVVKKNKNKINFGGERVSLSLDFQVYSPSLRKTRAGTMVKCCSLACTMFLYSYHFYTAQDPLPRDGTSGSGLDLPLSISSRGNAPTDMLTGQSACDRSSIETPSFQVILGCVKMNKRQTKTITKAIY